MRANFRPIRSSHGPYVCTTAIQASTICPTFRWTRPLDKVLRATVLPSALCRPGCSVRVRISPRSFAVWITLIDHQHFEQAGTWQRAAARFIRIAIKDRLQVNALQSREQQRDDGDRLDHTKPHSGLIPHLSLPDREKVCIAATSSVKFFNKLYLYQYHTYGTGLFGGTVHLVQFLSFKKDCRIHYTVVYCLCNRAAGKGFPTNLYKCNVWNLYY